MSLGSTCVVYQLKVTPLPIPVKPHSIFLDRRNYLVYPLSSLVPRNEATLYPPCNLILLAIKSAWPCVWVPPQLFNLQRGLARRLGFSTCGVICGRPHTCGYIQHQSQYTGNTVVYPSQSSPQKEYSCFHCPYILYTRVQYTFLCNLSSNSEQSEIDSFLYVVDCRPLLTTFIDSGYKSQ